jgi:hypothetical protein
MTLKLYTAFHLNLAYSSIEEEQRAEVVRRCYWPLLRLARDLGLPLGIEAPAYTLEAAAVADSEWLAEMRSLVTDGPCEFIGSGYAQLIGPLVPAEVNAANLRLGNDAYNRLLGFRPDIALVNEQAYSAGLVAHYLEAGHQAIVMEWDNPASTHPEWPAEWRYLPQVACGQHGEEIPLLWNKSLAFQKFQRYAHGEIELDEYLDYLGSHTSSTARAFPLYGGDIEVFDFRPGRYHTEAVLKEGVEWERIGRLFETLVSDDRFEFVPPSSVLGMRELPGAGNRLQLESPEQPIPVKKQGKYNLTRWAVTARDDLGVNTECWRAYERLRVDPAADDEAWRELCYLWSSDFRTHITEKRWAVYRERLAAFERKLGVTEPVPTQSAVRHDRGEAGTTTRTDGRFLTVQTDAVTLVLNTHRGLAIESLAFPGLSERPLAGTLQHGYYDDISLGADFYTGHVILEPPGAPKVTDLGPVEPDVHQTDDGVDVSAVVPTVVGPLRKRLRVGHDEAVVELTYEFDWGVPPVGSLRLGHVTLIPTSFERDSLYFACHNGGDALERFPLAGSSVDHGQPVSALVSASAGLGITGGVVELGDRTCALRVEVDRSCAALIGLVTYREVRGTFFCRLAFSAFELDETCRLGEQAQAPAAVRVTLRGASLSANSSLPRAEQNGLAEH